MWTAGSPVDGRLPPPSPPPLPSFLHASTHIHTPPPPNMVRHVVVAVEDVDLPAAHISTHTRARAHTQTHTHKHTHTHTHTRCHLAVAVEDADRPAAEHVAHHPPKRRLPPALDTRTLCQNGHNVLSPPNVACPPPSIRAPDKRLKAPRVQMDIMHQAPQTSPAAGGQCTHRRRRTRARHAAGSASGSGGGGLDEPPPPTPATVLLVLQDGQGQAPLRPPLSFLDKGRQGNLVSVPCPHLLPLLAGRVGT